MKSIVIFGIYFQDRDKGAARIHLSETIEELKKFNSRRKLKESVRKAIDSSKWHLDNSSDNFSDVGDDDIISKGIFILFFFFYSLTDFCNL